MKDLPITFRIAILVALVFSLAVIIGLLVVEPSEEYRREILASSDGESEDKPVSPAKVVLYPPVPDVLTDLNEGYLFNIDRAFEEIESGSAPSSAVDLTEVFYAGSLIIGEMHKGLITYQDKGPASRRPVSPKRGATQLRRPSVQAVYKHKQLALGEKFMGYNVDKIEKDRIVFKKDDDVVEKFLYDPSKQRGKVGAVAKPQSAKPRTVRSKAQQIPARSTANRVNSVAPKRVMPSSGNSAALLKAEKKRRSELLLGFNPSLGISTSPGVSGDPLRR